MAGPPMTLRVFPSHGQTAMEVTIHQDLRRDPQRVEAVRNEIRRAYILKQQQGEGGTNLTVSVVDPWDAVRFTTADV